MYHVSGVGSSVLGTSFAAGSAATGVLGSQLPFTGALLPVLWMALLGLLLLCVGIALVRVGRLARSQHVTGAVRFPR